ncbi:MULTISPECIES: LCP family protein [unclassified Paenibacillus]|uniref:LCP family glycopolymer transferase n=1 Tax=unclassified Paenibacillus TaxID=185978 RepID=UPI0007BEFFC6|nr:MULTISPECIES: LCP family protein [unclassified Paenibacillus]SEB07143.1 transcriptional attenuator, LytR family [Paenibacillus sp. 276b]SLK03401.1 transcriptional attenuator, LytR family [Paenibacillus sp. RU5A]SOC69295.1 transcriptional attenuator, LytR family [Paenibacillus sp. RU26A]SOC71739.1 transcriptional attenuator, LytR family [Paenibacillus sp. RU5M]
MKKWMKVTIWIVSLFVVVVFGYAIYLYQSVKSTADQIYEPRNPVKPVSVTDSRGGLPVDINSKEPFNALILGVDERPNDRGRSDTMIVLSVNPGKKQVLMFNIPRDTRTDIVGHNTVDKINHAYAFGGVDMSVNTVEQFLGVPIHYYMKVDMEGFAKIIDLVGGVDVNNPFAFDYEGQSYDQGNIHLDGVAALGFSRMRYDDPKGDLGRNDRQREVLKQMLKNTMQFSSVLHIQNMLDELGTHVRTDVTFDEMKELLLDYRNDLENVDTVEIKGKGEKINGIYYYIVDQQEKDRIHGIIEEHLEK